MATTYKVLGQVNTSTASATTLYTVPSATSAVISTLTVCNLGTSGTYRIAIRPGGASLSNQHYLVYDAGLAGNDTATFTLGITLATTDVVTVYASNSNFVFNLFGSEIT